MRKFLGLSAIVLVLFALAPVAHAQEAGVRDPFAPLIVPEPVGTGTDPTVPTDPSVIVDPDPDATEPLPETGSSTVTWFGLGYVLIALGGCAVAVSKLFGSTRLPAR